jgi:hypothetical protein
MTPEERAAHCRAIASAGGRATVARHGIAHMAAIGKRGFAAAVALGWGPELARKLAPSYEAKFARTIQLGPTAKERAELRRQARAIYGGNVCDIPGCELPGEVHHVGGLDAGNDETNILVLCRAHHVAHHRALRRARRLAREGADQ